MKRAVAYVNTYATEAGCREGDGARLRAGREAANLDLSQAAHLLRIRFDILFALEQGAERRFVDPNDVDKAVNRYAAAAARAGRGPA